MKILIDMNLSPNWVAEFTAKFIESVHWSDVGAANAEDSEIIKYAQENGYVIFTHDLDFGAILAVTQADGRALSRFEHKISSRFL